MKLASTMAEGQVTIHLTFPRRAGIVMPSYGYEFSSDLATWVPVESVSEVILSTQSIDSFEVESVDATMTVPHSNCGYVRLRW
jgi:hypothetical protein